MSAKPTGGPAFPVPEDSSFISSTGMTLRQWYAGMAMQALITLEGIDRDDITVEAYRQADSMIGYEKGEK